MEHSSYKIKTSYRKENLNLYVIYRLPSSSVSVFCNELLDIIEQEINETCNTLYIGNFNIHMDNPHHPDTIIFHDFVKSFNLTNLITEGSHKSQYTLDLIITDKSSNIALKPEMGHMLSEYSFIHCNLNMAKPMRKGTLITNCDVRKIDKLRLKEDLQVICNHVVAPDLYDVVTEYNTKLTGILESHVPLKQKKCRSCNNQPWFNDRMKDEKNLPKYGMEIQRRSKCLQLSGIL